MDLMEYKAKELFDKYHIPTMNGFVIEDLQDLELKTSGMKYPVVAKGQVQTGGRGKAGGIKFADNIGDLSEVSNSILGMNIKGHIVNKLLIVEKLEGIKEWYLSIMLDRFTKGPMVIFSPVGGMEIEETAKTTPEKVIRVTIDPLIGVNDYLPRYLLSKSKSEIKYFDQLFELIKNLYRLFCENDCMLVEINPLVISTENRLVALDAKVTVDDSALNRLPDILAFRDSLPEDKLVLEARKFGFLYIPCEENASIGVMSNGSGMIMSCIDLISREGMNVGAVLDLGGGATADRIQEAIRILLSNNSIKALFINIFGGITRCDEVAAGIKLAVDKLPMDKLIIVRLEGTNKKAGLDILNSIQNNVISVDGLREGVKELFKRKVQL
ncbi:MAG TPA: ADP-forming succinate--CoA ligase subunit beta [Leptolinea sp.]